MSSSLPREMPVSMELPDRCGGGASSTLEDSFMGNSNQIPRRNLSEAFEELYIEPTTGSKPRSIEKCMGSTNNSTISPTGVSEIGLGSDAQKSILKKESAAKSQIPEFCLHPDLQRELSHAVVNRVSFYCVIHDINKEACTMATGDFVNYNQISGHHDPLINAVKGFSTRSMPHEKQYMVNLALIDEEQWLLDVIVAQGLPPTKSCPTTFPQAMGEQDYKNPLASLSDGTRTQLWKPSRSWWEAKSGKNPWIEPKSHNRRWRYLWPLIHYHKFLARCIKKLKRNGIDVKTSISPVSAFLREEICVVSDHLASVSLFDSNTWMACLEHFKGWTASDKEAESRLRGLIAVQKLRPLGEPGDVDSPILRSQIDDCFLQTIASSRNKLNWAGVFGVQDVPTVTRAKGSIAKNRFESEGSAPRSEIPISTSSSSELPSQTESGSPRLRRARSSHAAHCFSPWWSQCWNRQPVFPYRDNRGPVSRQYEIGSYVEANGLTFYPQVLFAHLPFCPPHAPPVAGFENSLTDPSLYPWVGAYNSVRMGGGWVGSSMMDPTSNFMQQSHTSSSSYPFSPLPRTPHGECGKEEAPTQIPISPFWGHLDQATVAMMGIASPHRNPSSQTPRQEWTQRSGPDCGNLKLDVDVDAKPLSSRQEYYTLASEKVQSPATQFVMSPQARHEDECVFFPNCNNSEKVSSVDASSVQNSYNGGEVIEGRPPSRPAPKN